MAEEGARRAARRARTLLRGPSALLTVGCGSSVSAEAPRPPIDMDGLCGDERSVAAEQECDQGADVGAGIPDPLQGHIVDRRGVVVGGELFPQLARVGFGE